MKKLTRKLTALFLTGIMILTATGSMALSAAEPAQGAGTIGVTGTGSVKVKPDIAYVNVGVQTENTDAKAAQADNNTKIQAVVAKMKELGIADTDIKTNGYSMYPRYDYSNPASAGKITGYTVHNSVSLTLRDINKVGETVDAAVAAGANMNNSIQFSVADTTAYYTQALTLAIANAKSKGTVIASAIGKTIGTPLSISENGGYYAPIAYAEAAMGMKDAGASMPVQTGELEITATVSVVYAY